MAPANPAVLASAGVIALSMAVATAIAVYESPELRRMADDLRRRIAIALHSLGDGVQPPARDPLFNRPEDAEGFLQSRAVAGNAPGVDADAESLRRQREELIYWNAVLEEKKKSQGVKAETPDTTSPTSKRASTFDDFLLQDSNAEQGTYVYNTGVEVHGDDAGLLRRRVGAEGVRGLKPSWVYENPFADEHGIDDFDDQPATESHSLSPGNDEIMPDDIYNATPAASQTLSPRPVGPVAEVLFDHFDTNQPMMSEPEPATSLIDRELPQDEYMTAGQADRHDAYASVQAWAQNSNPNFYSPLPMSPPAPLSEPEIIDEGPLTPTDSSSLAGSGEDIGNDASSSHAGEDGRHYDVMSEDEDGMPTPTSWTEVGSVVSEGESAVHEPPSRL